MKQMKQLSTLFLLICFSSSLMAQNMTNGNGLLAGSSSCEWYRQLLGFPAHYCDCLEDYERFTLPMDIQIDPNQWYKTSMQVIESGMTAYLYSDTDVRLEVYVSCASSSPSYTYTFTKNQARSVDGDKIRKKLEEAGVAGLTDYMALYLRIVPEDNGSGRILCSPYNQGPNSTCENLLSLLMSMTFISSHAEDVYQLDSDLIPHNEGIAINWDSDVACTLMVTRGSCEGAELIQAELLAGQTYQLPMDLLADVRSNNENLYLHFSHTSGSVGRICLTTYTPTPTPTSVNSITTPVAAQLYVATDGSIYIMRDGQRFTLMGNKL